MRHLKIEFVSDVVCPWCAIGLGNLERALEKLAGEVEAELNFEPFELNPHMAAEGQDLSEHIHQKYGSTPEEMAQTRARLTALGAAAGYTFHYGEGSRIWNTFDAHRLLHWAGQAGRQRELKKALFRAYFTAQQSVSDPSVLLGAVAEAGLDVEAARAILESDAEARAVRQRESLWRQRGIQGVPAIIINGRHLIQGGQAAEFFEQALREIAAQAEAPAA